MDYEQNVEKTNKKLGRENTYAVITGIVAGLVNGLFGGGGGMIVVPMLIKLLNCPPKKAHATALLIILPLSITSGIIYAVFGNLNLRVGIPVGIGVVLGGVIGAFLLSKLSTKWVIIIFSVVMAGAGVKMLLF
ncbi:MAG: sulfite exporter TauE/SafE family protein [Clostridiales bacterium]|nr:sulfite exporter TauE/SafE family protein [Clostridiales bacterium]